MEKVKIDENRFNGLTDSTKNVRCKLEERCKQKGVEVRDGAYQISRYKCLDYLSKMFLNLPDPTIETLLDNLILDGQALTKKGKDSERWYILIMVDTGVPPEKATEEENE